MLKTTLALTLATAMVLPATMATAEAKQGPRYYKMTTASSTGAVTTVAIAARRATAPPAC